MKEMKDYLKTKSLVINSEVFKNISKLNLTLNEFLLLVYFMNIDNHLDLERVKMYLCFDDEEILNLYTSLISKGLIEIKVNKVNKQIDEEISLELFYDKLLLNKENDKKSEDIFSIFESEFGRTLSPMEYEMINGWLSNGIDEELIKNALKEAVINGINGLKYVDRILYEWTKKGNNKGSDEGADFEPLFDYEWLDEKE